MGARCRGAGERAHSAQRRPHPHAHGPGVCVYLIEMGWHVSAVQGQGSMDQPCPAASSAAHSGCCSLPAGAVQPEQPPIHAQRLSHHTPSTPKLSMPFVW